MEGQSPRDKEMGEIGLIGSGLCNPEADVLGQESIYFLTMQLYCLHLYAVHISFSVSKSCASYISDIYIHTYCFG